MVVFHAAFDSIISILFALFITFLVIYLYIHFTNYLCTYYKFQVLWAQDLRIKHLNVYVDNNNNNNNNYSNSPAPASSGGDVANYQHSFELIVAKSRKRAQYSVVLTCEDEAAKLSW